MCILYNIKFVTLLAIFIAIQLLSEEKLGHVEAFAEPFSDSDVDFKNWDKRYTRLE